SESSQSWRNSKPDSARSWKGRDASARTPSGDGFRRGGGGGRKSFGASSADGSGANVVPVEVIPGEALHGIHGVRQALRCNMRVFHKLMLRDTNGQTASATAASKKATPDMDRHLKEIKSLALEYGIPVTYERYTSLATLDNVLRASVGSSEVLAYERRLFETSNMHQALASCQQLGWTLVGACSGTKAVSSAAYEITSPTILVVVQYDIYTPIFTHAYSEYGTIF
ncbi:hypothetical protein DYB37_008537, partial [Aphanomyces astaci]